MMRSLGGLPLRWCAVILAAQLAATADMAREQLSLDANWKFHLGDIPRESFPGGQGIALYGADITHSDGKAGHVWGAAARGYAAGQLQISWPADHTGWQLQSQTNNLTSGLGTNWVNMPASMQTNQMTVPLNSANGSVFFRLMRP
jgi:hypothetical protein